MSHPGLSIQSDADLHATEAIGFCEGMRSTRVAGGVCDAALASDSHFTGSTVFCCMMSQKSVNGEMSMPLQGLFLLLLVCQRVRKKLAIPRWST